MARTRLRPLGLVLLGLLAAVPAAAAPPAPFPDTPRTMGQPRRVSLTWGPLGGYDFDAERQRSRLFVAANATPSIPQVGLANMTLEGVVRFIINGSFRSYRMARPREIRASLPEGERPKPGQTLEATEMPAGLEASMGRVEAPPPATIRPERRSRGS